MSETLSKVEKSKLANYIISMRECIDEWWLANFQYDSSNYELVFDTNFNFVSVELLDSNSKWIKQLPKFDSYMIYKLFLHKVFNI
jgi:hypothetical protein